MLQSIFLNKFMLCNILRKFSFLRNDMSLFLLYFLCLARMFLFLFFSKQVFLSLIEVHLIYNVVLISGV